MAKIKIKDLPKDQKIGKGEMKRVKGGAAYIKFNPYTYFKPVPQGFAKYEEPVLDEGYFKS